MDIHVLVCLGILSCIVGLVHPLSGGKTLQQLIREARTQGEAHEVCTTVTEPEREDCGYYGIQAEECLDNNCCWLPSEVSNTPWCFFPKSPMVNGCGSPAIPPAESSDMEGSVDAIPHSWPWQVSLQENGKHSCGGSLIAPRWIITAFQCLPSDSEKMVLGLQTMSSPSDVTIEVGYVSVFYEYGYGYDEQGMLLIRLNQDVEYSSEISPVCLPESNAEIPEGSICYSTGWGSNSSGGALSDTLQQVRAPIISRDTCNQLEWYEGRITGNLFCAGNEESGVDPCQIDNGVPLVCYVQGRWILTGLTSWNFQCVQRHNPGVYTNVAAYIDWIEMIRARYGD